MRFVIVQLGLLALCNAHAQNAHAPLTFEVASVKASAPDAQSILRPSDGGNLRMEGATLKNLIAYAYGVRELLISGGPAWADNDRFDIDARAGAGGSPRETAERLRSLLADRFALTIHKEAREQSVYALMVAKNGPKFAEAKPETNSSFRRRGNAISGEAATMQLLARSLANVVGRPVLDKTGLTGSYDFKLEWTPEAALSRNSTSASATEIPLASDPASASVFAALQEQLGLRIESQKAPVETFVIDHVALPSPN
jgi:uncharacterized protein (TIGR03435 family)